VLDDTRTSWWYEQDGQQAGPVTAAAIGRLVAEGRLGPAHRVWRDGMAGWEPLAAVADLAPALQAAPPTAAVAPPPLSARPPAPGPAPRSGPAPGAPAAAPTLEPIPVAGVILLSFVTFGIYGLVKFHQTGMTYEALAGRTSSFSRNFWLFVGLGVGGVFGNAVAPGLGVPFAIASFVFQVMTLQVALALRGEGMGRAGIRPEVTSDGTHKALFVVGALLSFVLVGLVLLVVQAAKWFADWNEIRAALAARAPAPGAGGAAFGAR
jgi:hypothetical protein